MSETRVILYYRSSVSMYTQKNDDKNFRTGFFFFPMSQLSGSEVSMVVSRGTIQNLRFDQTFSNLLSILLYCEVLLQIKVNFEFEKPPHSSPLSEFKRSF